MSPNHFEGAGDHLSPTITSFDYYRSSFVNSQIRVLRLWPLARCLDWLKLASGCLAPEERLITLNSTERALEESKSPLPFLSGFETGVVTELWIG